MCRHWHSSVAPATATTAATTAITAAAACVAPGIAVVVLYARIGGSAECRHAEKGHHHGDAGTRRAPGTAIVPEGALIERDHCLGLARCAKGRTEGHQTHGGRGDQRKDEESGRLAVRQAHEQPSPAEEDH